MKQFEYRAVSPTFYNQCLTKANILLKQISETLNKPKIKITPLDIIEFFEINYNILFTFFEEAPSHNINKFEGLVRNSSFECVNIKLANRLPGFTYPSNGRIVIMVNQTLPRSRVIYTILHELCHLYFHNIEENKKYLLQNSMEFILIVSSHMKMKRMLLLPFYSVLRLN
ncbi:SprT-like domain-containing protein [Lactococcus sp. DD01]|uniref:SprT-like domain-containing protein n=1 Tax=Lactococcus sp. DD01 TaxID=1776443 RepID=UPI000A73AEBE|nr:SprT-like domain-containing protein [Lactococcus sp. DD01]